MMALSLINISLNPSITLRKANQTDFQFISDVGFSEMNSILLKAWNGKFNWESWHKDIIEAARGSYHKVFVIQIKNNPVGYLWCNEEQESLWITAIVINSSWQRKGIGSKIMEYLIKESLRFGKEYIELGVQRNNKVAFYFYSKFGFEPIDFLRNANTELLRLKLSEVKEEYYR